MFSEKNRYVLKLMTFLAAIDDGRYRTVEDLAGETDLPKPYLSKIVRELASKGYLETRKGPEGGARLRQDPSEIAIEDLLEDMDALSHNEQGDACCVSEIFDHCYVDDWIDGFKENVLRGRSLADMVSTLQSGAN